MSPLPWIVTLVLLALNGFFVAVEFALVGSRRSRLEELAADGSKRSQLAVDASERLNVGLAGAQLGITMASLGLGYVSEPAAVELLQAMLGPIGLSEGVEHLIAFIIGLSIIVFLHLVFGEMVPKGIALADPERSLLRLVQPNRWYLVLFGPVVRLFNWVAGGLTRLVFRVEPNATADVHTADELAVMLAESRAEGLIEDFAHDLLAGVLHFDEKTAAEVLVPPDDVTVVSRGATVAQVEDVVVASGHSRLLVVGEGGIDDVLGFVHSKDLLTASGLTPGRRLPPRLIRRMIVVPPERSLEEVLLTMRRTRVHLALVRDGDGRTCGIVTLEDLLEELVGDILDESDRP
ncbi:MAG: HlyC/CorC family transporter [Acidimicrobiales bacterium]|nr:HlyC/CorC family transporter [Acidimicrobiales bacterium]